MGGGPVAPLTGSSNGGLGQVAAGTTHSSGRSGLFKMGRNINT
jgi:hypothetical protein